MKSALALISLVALVPSVLGAALDNNGFEKRQLDVVENPSLGPISSALSSAEGTIIISTIAPGPSSADAPQPTASGIISTPSVVIATSTLYTPPASVIPTRLPDDKCFTVPPVAEVSVPLGEPVTYCTGYSPQGEPHHHTHHHEHHPHGTGPVTSYSVHAVTSSSVAPFTSFAVSQAQPTPTYVAITSQAIVPPPYTSFAAPPQVTEAPGSSGYGGQDRPEEIALKFGNDWVTYDLKVHPTSN